MNKLKTVTSLFGDNFYLKKVSKKYIYIYMKIKQLVMVDKFAQWAGTRQYNIYVYNIYIMLLL